MKNKSDHCNNYLKHIVCNISSVVCNISLFVISHQLSHEKYADVSLGLDHDIPSKADPNLIYLKFEFYYQNMVHKIENF